MKRKLLILCNLLLCLTLFAQAQTRVTGRVTSSADGSGVMTSIVVKGTSTGVNTDIDGRYTINNVPSGATLVFAALGFERTEVAVNGRSVVNVTLKATDRQLEEVMVVAYGTVKKGTYTGAASTVNPDIDVPAASFQDLLNGRASGVQMFNSSGQAGSAPNIRIRGRGSMNASNEPLYVVDGVPMVSGNAGQMSDYTTATNNYMSSLNPSDIESITILKDAAASSLYGSRAANGVVLVTTKKGKNGAPTVNFRSSIE